ncbi:MAG: hypothetical protein K1Y36_29965 [Blastocatellia bacterium]|nr:hypothetical protein [Blastocatellia bacterium]
MSKDLSNKLKSIVHKAQPAIKKGQREKVRPDSFSLLQSEHETIQKLMSRAFQNGRDVSKSEIIRAAIKSLDGLNDEAFLQMLESLQRVKAGRPPHKQIQ